jgi:oligopeptide transport system substrate-binding protein
LPISPQTGTRELVADDYIYQIKRLAHPRLHSPIFSMMAERIVGLRGTRRRCTRKRRRCRRRPGWISIAFRSPASARVDRYTYRITLRGKYPQFVYWLAMPFFAPVPREVDRFYQQPGMAEKNLTLDWYPVGTGPFMLTENNPNSRMVLERNPNFHGETYPCEGEADDAAAGLLPMRQAAAVHRQGGVFAREGEHSLLEQVPAGLLRRVRDFLDSFDQAVRSRRRRRRAADRRDARQGDPLLTSVRASIFYMGFNMLDPVVGGLSEEARRSCARRCRSPSTGGVHLDLHERPRHRGDQPAAAGHLRLSRRPRRAINPVVYDWVDGRPRRKPIEVAKKLLAEAGWPNGRNAKTGEPLVLNLDTTTGGMGDKSRLDWLTRQFAKLDIQLVVRSTDFNRFQEKVRKGAVQLYYLGWNADYPDPENFLFLLAGPKARSPRRRERLELRQSEFDRLFEQHEEHGERRPARRRALAIIRMKAIAAAARRAVDLRLSSEELHPRPWLAAQPQADRCRQQHPQVSAHRRRRARALAAAMEWPVLWPLALAAALLLGGGRLAGGDRLSPPRARHGALMRAALGRSRAVCAGGLRYSRPPCSPTSSAACSTRCRS